MEGKMEKIPFRIDPEFQNKIPPIGEDEFRQLRENILADGKVTRPLTVWNGILVDGHNRWKVIQEFPNLPWSVEEKDFPDKWAAFEWMYKNQLGRRNLTDEQRAYTIGKIYEARKNIQGGNRGNQYTKMPSAQNEHMPRVSEQIAHEVGVGKETVKRAEKFANGVDALRNVNPEAADKVLSGKAKLSKKAVAEIAKMASMDVDAVAESIMNDMAMPAPKEEPPEEPPAYGIDSLLEIVQANGAKYISMLKMSIETRRFVISTDEDKALLRNAITEIISEIEKVRETL